MAPLVTAGPTFPLRGNPMKITNTSRANQGVHTTEGLVFIEPGQTLDLDVRPDYRDRVSKLPFLTVEGAALDHDGDGKAGGSVDELDQMKVADLRLLAETETIDLGEATKKADIIAAIRAARAAKAAETDGDEEVRTDDQLRAAVIEQYGEDGSADLTRAEMIDLLAAQPEV